MTISELNNIIKTELQKNRRSEDSYKEYLRQFFKLYRDSVKQLSDKSLKEDLPDGKSREYLSKEIQKRTNAH